VITDHDVLMATATTMRPEGREPRHVTASSSLTLAFTASTRARVILAAVLAFVAVQPPHYHLAAEHDDPIALGTELGLVLVVLLFVGRRLVACRLLLSSHTWRSYSR
jgi:hypothetical protein